MKNQEFAHQSSSEFLPVNDRAGWKFPNDYTNHLVNSFASTVGASADRSDPNVSDPVRELILREFPELKSTQVSTLVGAFLTRVRNERKRRGSMTGVMPVASQHKSKQGGRNH